MLSALRFGMLGILENTNIQCMFLRESKDKTDRFCEWQENVQILRKFEKKQSFFKKAIDKRGEG